jgi:hypothetical protein
LTTTDLLAARRDHLCRLTPERHLESLEEAVEFVADRQMLTLLPDCSLPSLFGACDPPEDPAARGFARWPEDKWWWDMALAGTPGIRRLRIHRGKGLFVSAALLPVLDPLCGEELRRAEAGERGEAAAVLVHHLDAAGPSLIDDVKEELGLDARVLRALRDRLEPWGAVVSREVRVPAGQGGHRHTSELSRWDQVFSPTAPPSGPGGLGELVVAGVRAAVLAAEAEVRTWFTWPVQPSLVDGLLRAGRLASPAPGWLAAGPAEAGP